MNLKYITCSDPREYNDVHDIVALAFISPRAEIAIQAHPSKMSPGMPRNEWTNELIKFARSYYYNLAINKKPMPKQQHFAIHINNEWATQICKTGRIPNELHNILSARYDLYFYTKPIIGRIQINIPHNVVNEANVIDMARMMDANRDYQFIVQYNAKTSDLVNRLYDCHARFSPLFDASGGRGISPDTWRAPVFSCGTQGYSGGLSPENVESCLDKIDSVVPWYRDIWIDAEGKLKTDDKFDVARARQYILNAENWLTKQKQK